MKEENNPDSASLLHTIRGFRLQDALHHRRQRRFNQEASNTNTTQPLVRSFSRIVQEAGDDGADARNVESYDDDGDALDFNHPSRERTLTLMRMCVLSYPSCQERTTRYSSNNHHHKPACGYSNAVMEPIWKHQEAVLGRNITNRASYDQANQNFYDKQRQQVLKDGWVVRDVSAPQETATFDTGVAAFEWKRDNTTVLVFRGTSSQGDDGNIENWIMDYVLEKSTAHMKRAWTQDAQLPWTTTMQKRAHRSDAWERWFLRTAESSFATSRTVKDRLEGDDFSFAQELVDAVKSDPTLVAGMGGLSLREAKATGYWKITKYIVDQVVQNLPDENHTLVLTGHSQGGTRAQFASMYLYHSRGWRVPTVTFAATGSACAARRFFSDHDILADVDPFVEYDNMVDYVHPLDPWGNSMLGIDNGKDVCFFGTKATQLAEASSLSSAGTTTMATIPKFDGAYQYCSRVYGWSGPTILVSRSGVAASLGRRGGPSHPHDLNLNFARCRYYTHNAATMLVGLEEFVKADGTTTDGGCRRIPVIPEHDPNRMCPTGRVPLGEEIMSVKLLVLFALAIALFCVGLCRCCRFCYLGSFGQKNVGHAPRTEFETLARDDSSGASIELPRLA